MQRHTAYRDVVSSVVEFLAVQAALASRDGVETIIVDPGIGFGKTTRQNLELIDRLDEIVALGYPVLVGASRKRFIGEVTGVVEPAGRDVGTVVAHLGALDHGARLLRVHDVRSHREALAMRAALERGHQQGDGTR